MTMLETTAALGAGIPPGLPAWAAAFGFATAVALAAWRLAPRPPGRRIAGVSPLSSGPGRSRWRRWGRRPSTAEPYAVFLDALARELRIGAGLSGAFVTVAATHPATHPVVGRTMAAVRDGQAFGAALVLAADDAADTDDADAAFVVQALRCVDTIGGPAAVTLDAAASVLRERAAVVADAAAHSAQARLSARVLTIVPLGFAGWSLIASDQTRRTSLGSPLGALCIATGLALNGVGWWWMRRIVCAAQPAGRGADGSGPDRRAARR